MKTTATAGVPTAPGRPAQLPDRPPTRGCLYIDPGVGPDGRSIRQPRAKYECYLCATTDGPVYGVDDVIAFAKSARSNHRANCTADDETSPRS